MSASHHAGRRNKSIMDPLVETTKDLLFDKPQALWNRTSQAFTNRTTRGGERINNKDFLFSHWKYPAIIGAQDGNSDALLVTDKNASKSREIQWIPAVGSKQDNTLEKMVPVLTHKQLHGVTLQDFYDRCWSLGDFYQEWLQLDEAKHDIEISDWTKGTFVGVWDKETYTQQRVVKYQYDRDPETLGYNLGKPVVHCTQTQWYRSLVNDEQEQIGSVLAMTLSMEGEVGSDSFLVHIRGVATKLISTTIVEDAPNHHHQHAIQIDFGIFCQFTKTSLLANQIRKIANESTKEQLQTLYAQMKETCGAVEVESTLTDHQAMLDEEGGPPDAFAAATTNVGGDECAPWRTLQDFCRYPSRSRLLVLNDLEMAEQEINKILKELPKLKGIPNALQAQIAHAQEQMTNALQALHNIQTRDAQGSQILDMSAQTATTATTTENPSGDSMATTSIRTRRRPIIAQISHWNHQLLGLPRQLMGGSRGSAVGETRRKQKRHVEDPILRHMNVLVSTLADGSLSAFSKWLGPNSNNLFLAHLETSRDCQNLSASKWRMSDTTNPVTDGWSQEPFDAERTLNFDLQTSDGSPVCVRHVHRFRMEDNVRLIFAATVTTQGKWYSDLFEIHIRWVVHQLPSNSKVAIKIGVFIPILWHSEAAEKVTADAHRITTIQQLSLLQMLLKKVDESITRDSQKGGSNQSVVDSQATREASTGSSPIVESLRLDGPSPSVCLSCPAWTTNLDIRPGTLLACSEDLLVQYRRVQRNFEHVRKILGRSSMTDPSGNNSSELKNYLMAQLTIVKVALQDILHYSPAPPPPTDPTSFHHGRSVYRSGLAEDFLETIKDRFYV